ncbi:hypothetical protein [Methylobacterium sp. CCH5-D2]|uniref:DUF6894 family protein n=1 Tax=Methylobacterium sp. CCH5-D2 TaxID=1768765 RepID=UPI0008375EA2|nr:hypothetical protein [Methylobacterium sp. CCH5-D2]
MPLFYFDVRTQHGLDADDTGLELGSAEAAFLAGFAAIPGMALDLMRHGKAPGGYAFQIRDRSGNLLWDIPFGEVLGQVTELPRRP